MTAGYINEEIFELSIFENGDIQAERIFCEQWMRNEYGLKEERLNDDYLREALDIRTEDLDDFIRITNPEQAVDQLSELVRMSIWSISQPIFSTVNPPATEEEITLLESTLNPPFDFPVYLFFDNLFKNE